MPKDRITGIRQRIRELKEKGEEINIIVDSTGIKIYGENEWKVRQHGKGKRRKWKKMHVGIDKNTRQAISYIMTGNNVHDGQVFDVLVDEIMKYGIKIKKFYGDGAYHQHSIIERLNELGIEPMVPLPKNAVISGEHTDEAMMVLRARDKLLLKQYEAGGMEKWKKSTDYHYRSLIENFFSRLKTIFGEKLRHKNDAIRSLRLRIRTYLLNKFTNFGLPKYA